MKWYLPAFCLAAFSATVFAQEADPCAGLLGAALGQCQANQQKLQRQQLAQQQQQLAQQQQQLTQQQQQLMQQQRQPQPQERSNRPSEPAQNQQQLEDMQHQIELLSKQVESQKSANQPVTAAAMESKRRELQNWKAENPWYGSQYTKTQFAIRYSKQLQQEQPDLVGRPFLDAISAKVTDKFGADK
jgi:DNA repair exonuclease SbcCD ATPase subunit